MAHLFTTIQYNWYLSSFSLRKKNTAAINVIDLFQNLFPISFFFSPPRAISDDVIKCHRRESQQCANRPLKIECKEKQSEFAPDNEKVRGKRIKDPQLSQGKILTARSVTWEHCQLFRGTSDEMPSDARSMTKMKRKWRDLSQGVNPEAY